MTELKLVQPKHPDNICWVCNQPFNERTVTMDYDTENNKWVIPEDHPWGNDIHIPLHPGDYPVLWKEMSKEPGAIFTAPVHRDCAEKLQSN